MSKFIFSYDIENNLNSKMFILIPKIKDILNSNKFYYKNGLYDAENFNETYLARKNNFLNNLNIGDKLDMQIEIEDKVENFYGSNQRYPLYFQILLLVNINLENCIII